MTDRKAAAETFEAQRLRAAQKVARQSEVVRRMNGAAHDHPDAQHLLSQMQHNRVAIDLNRALFEYEDDKGPQPNKGAA